MVCLSYIIEIILGVKKSPTVLNNHLGIRDFTLTSCQKAPHNPGYQCVNIDIVEDNAFHHMTDMANI